jgi:hypothetical protein
MEPQPRCHFARIAIVGKSARLVTGGSAAGGDLAIGKH